MPATRTPSQKPSSAARREAQLGFRIIEFNVLGNHLHLITEADSKEALSRGMRAEQQFTKTWIDPFSSAAWFGGWASPIRADEPWKRELLALDKPTFEPTVWLLTTGWRRHGPLRFDERPA